MIFIGVWNMQDYGISWDEAVQREHGLKSYYFLLSKWNGLFGIYNPAIPEISIHQLSSYGTLFQTIATGIEKLFDLNTTSEYFYLRHWMVYTLFTISAYVFYLLIKIRFNYHSIAILGLLMYVCTPRIFGHAFFNGKDIVFMAVTLFAIFSLTKWVYSNKYKWLFVHALFTAICISTRSLGIYIGLLSLAFITLRLLNKPDNIKNALTSLFAYGLFSMIFCILLWPYLWKIPIKSLTESIKRMAQFDWGGDVLLDGTFYAATDVPWFYTLRWINVTTPIIFQILILSGLLLFVVRLFRQKYKWSAEQIVDIIILLAFTAPLIAVILFYSTLYDGWRHMYFIWPFLLYFAAYGLFQTITWPTLLDWKYKDITYCIMGMILILPVSYSMCSIHPFQNVYFNQLAKENWVENYELDYWGQGYKETMIRFAESIPDDVPVCIIGSNYPAWECYQTLPENIKDKLHYVWKEEFAEYYISNFRSEWILENYKQKEHLMKNEVYTIKLGDQVIFGVFQLFE